MDLAHNIMQAAFGGYKYCCDRSNLMGKELGDLIVAKVNMKK